MSRFSRAIPFSLLVLLCTFFGSGRAIIHPRYCIDEAALTIFRERLQQCGITSPLDEVEQLHKGNAIEFQRGSHELLAFQWLVQPYNPYRVNDCEHADLEYIPLLPLNWKVKVATSDSRCTYRELIAMIENYMKQNTKKGKRPFKFAVASTFNMRTEMGTGMKDQVRRGVQYDTVTSFVTGLFLGHYERWPQCPDLLRKGWAGIVELPYVAMGEKIDGYVASSRAAQTLGDSSSLSDSKQLREKRPVKFLFVGRLNQLYGPELVCSVRLSIFAAAKNRSDLRVVNITDAHTQTGVQQEIVAAFSSAVFCIIAKADSYSSGSFYTAIQEGCIPVVLSDWFVFAFPWVVRYDDFVVRFSETNWLMDPSACLDFLERMSVDQIAQRRMTMARYIGLLRFHALPEQSKAMLELRALWTKEQILQLNSSVDQSSLGDSGKKDAVDWKYNVIVPFELMLFEVLFLARDQQFQQQPQGEAVKSKSKQQKQFGLTLTHRADKIFSCETPFHCASNGTDFSGTISPAVVVPSLQNKRSHLCSHAHRLIGMYKMVYFQKCVRVLWPLHPGRLKPNDQKLLAAADKRFIQNFHNVSSRPAGWQLFPYPSL